MRQSNKRQKADIAVIGSGLTGLTSALALANYAPNIQIVHIGPMNTGTDGRTTAFLMPSVAMFQELGLWKQLRPYSTPLSTMRMIDGSKRLIRAPLTDFRAAELDMEAFGYNVPNAQLGKLLEAEIARHPNINRIAENVVTATPTESGVKLQLDIQQIEADFVAAADGRRSLLRQAANIEIREWSYPQTAIALNFAHALPHNDVSTEFHTETGPFTQVPLPALKSAKHRSSLVWVVRPEMCHELLALKANDLSRIVERKMQSMLGEITIEGTPQSFPLSGMIANHFAANNIALLGEAAHVFPPIGAQGFNLGLRDIKAFVKAYGSGGNIEKKYNQARQSDVTFRTNAVDSLNRSLLTDFLPVQALRAAGLTAAGQIPWLRRQLMKHGMGAK